VYFNYHAKVKKLIKEGHATGFEIKEEYHKICPCLLIYFDNHIPMPIREKHFEEYLFLLTKYGVVQTFV